MPDGSTVERSPIDGKGQLVRVEWSEDGSRFSFIVPADSALGEASAIAARYFDWPVLSESDWTTAVITGHVELEPIRTTWHPFTPSVESLPGQGDWQAANAFGRLVIAVDPTTPAAEVTAAYRRAQRALLGREVTSTATREHLDPHQRELLDHALTRDRGDDLSWRNAHYDHHPETWVSLRERWNQGRRKDRYDEVDTRRPGRPPNVGRFHRDVLKAAGMALRVKVRELYDIESPRSEPMATLDEQQRMRTEAQREWAPVVKADE